MRRALTARAAPLPRPKRRTEELHEHILQVAAELIETEGMQGFTTRRLAEQASTSTPAIYELFGDKGGLVRQIFFEGFRRLASELDGLRRTDDPREDVCRLLQAFRCFYRENPAIAAVMFSRPVPEFDPGPSEQQAGRAVREHFVGCVQRAIDSGILDGNATDIAHVLLALAQGMAAVEVAGWLGTSNASVQRRWRLAIDAVLDGFSPMSRGS
jgi:AcrR family transcriptional regulator